MIEVFNCYISIEVGFAQNIWRYVS